jgi:PAS domain S-box-containing protein
MTARSRHTPPDELHCVATPEALLELVESGLMGLHVIAEDGTILWANRADYEPLGYGASEYVGHSIFEFHSDREGVSRELEKLKAGEAVRTFEAEMQCRDGSARSVLITASPKFDESGTFLHTQCFAQSLSDGGPEMRESGERRRVSAPPVTASGPTQPPPAPEFAPTQQSPSTSQPPDSLRDPTSDQLQMVADSLPVLIAYIGSDLRYRFANRAYESWFCIERDRVSGMLVSDLLGPAAFEAVRPYLDRALSGELVTFEAVMPYVAAGTRFIRGTYVPRRDDRGNVDGFVALISDVSPERKAAYEREELLRKEQAARERLTILAKASDVLAQSLDYERTLTSVTELVLPLLGDFGFFDIREGEQVRRIAKAHGDARLEALLRESKWEPASLQNGDACALSTGRSCLHDDIDLAWIRRAANTPEQLAHLQSLGFHSMISVPVAYQGTTMGALTLFFTDPERRHSENDVTLAEELARRAAAAIVNARLFKEAQEAIGVRDDFLSMAGHELRTPLTALQLQILSISKMVGQVEGSEKIAGRADKAAKNVLRLSSLVNELLDISRISAGRLRLERAPMDLAEAVREVVQRHSEELARNGCELHFTSTGDTTGSWDPVRVEQIATNLLTNAIKYGKGKPIEVRVTREGDSAHLVIADHGIGISPEDQQRVFQRFERAVSARHFGGLGLGLWIARQLIDAHGGTIRVSSEKDRGATFELTLPVAQPNEEQPS